MPEGILDFFELVWAESQSLDSRESKKDIIWLTPEGKNVILNVYPLVAFGTRYSAAFAVFLKLQEYVRKYDKKWVQKI